MQVSDRMSPLLPSTIRSATYEIERSGGINLGQGSCNVENAPYYPDLVAAAERAMALGTDPGGVNTYAHSSGVEPLRRAIAAKLARFNGIVADPDADSGTIIVTAGATGALCCAYDALVDPGDEVIMFEPYYQYHVNTLRLRGGVARPVKLRGPDWEFDPDELVAAVGPRTKALLICNPSNPSGKVFTLAELEIIARLCIDRDLVLLTDEVYEFITYDGRRHISAATLPGMADRTVTLGSFSKTLAITGWRIGYAVAPGWLAPKIRLANEFNYICAPAPLQHAVAELVDRWEIFRPLAGFYQEKRDLIVAALADAGFDVTSPQGAYYILADFRRLGLGDELAAVRALIDRIGVATVPGRAFYHEGSERTTLLRFCFAFRDAGLAEAARRLKSLAQPPTPG